MVRCYIKPETSSQSHDDCWFFLNYQVQRLFSVGYAEIRYVYAAFVE